MATSAERTLNKKWQSRLLRWSVLGLCWSSYILYRGCVIGQIKYDKEKGKLIIQRRNIWTKRIVLCLKLSVLYFSFESNEGIFSSPKYFDTLMTGVIMQIAICNIIRLWNWMSSLSYNRSLVGLINEVIEVNTLMKETLGRPSLEGISLLILYIVQWDFTVLQITGLSQLSLYVFPLYIILLELCFNIYVVYQLLLLSWIAAFNRFLKIYLQERKPTKRQHLKVLRLLRLYSRIANINQEIQLLWLPVIGMLFTDILLLVINWAFIIKNIMEYHLFADDKFYRKCLRAAVGGQASFLRILFIGLCNDRLCILQTLLRVQLLIVDLRFSLHLQRHQNFVRDVQTLQSCFDVQFRVQPIRNRIMNANLECGGSFVLDFFFCTLLNALCFAQYEITVDADTLIYAEDR
ncbi:gustatory receptor-like 36a [Drosophila takahashii]|uniref:gustatory receptor-like 36a n=1 Tax=Drosophila takahashii TaxID=29030 RepID=UPI001CF868D8|nr:uncharacterized protein CG31750-like [Drosophila takahashii]